MTNTMKMFELSELAEAAYADFTNINASTPATIIEARLKDAAFNMAFSDVQATEFADNWKVVSHQPNTSSGYSGTLFEYIGNDTNSGFTQGQQVFAQRGTEPTLADASS